MLSFDSVYKSHGAQAEVSVCVCEHDNMSYQGTFRSATCLTSLARGECDICQMSQSVGASKEQEGSLNIWLRLR